MQDELHTGKDVPTGPARTPIDGALPPTPVDAASGPMRGDGRRESAFMGVPIDVMISVGKARPLVADLVKLRRDSVITLNSKIDDPVELYIGERLIARGELQEMDDGSGQLGVRLTEVADLSKGV
jgi:flagellar motor switch protein FliN